MAGATPRISLTPGAFLWAAHWCFEPADQISVCPSAPAGGRHLFRILMIGEGARGDKEEPLFCERAAGIDIGKQSVMVTVRVPSETRKGGRAQETREFGTTRRQLLELADWLRFPGGERAGMESTSDYWKPVYFLLEQQGLECVLYQASKVKAQPGRPKTGKLDSVWLGKGAGEGSVGGAWVQPE